MLGWILNLDFAASGVEAEPEEEAVAATGGWIREEELDKVVALYRNRGKLRARAKKARATLVGHVTRRGYEPSPTWAPVEQAEAFNPPAPTAVGTVSGRLRATGPVASSEIVGSIGVGTEDLDYVRNIVSLLEGLR